MHLPYRQGKRTSRHRPVTPAQNGRPSYGGKAVTWIRDTCDLRLGRSRSNFARRTEIDKLRGLRGE